MYTPNGKPCNGCGDAALGIAEHPGSSQGGLAAYIWDNNGKARGLGGLGSVFDFPTITGVVQLAMGQVRFAASGVNTRLMSEDPAMLEALKLTEGYCIAVSGERLDSGFWVSGFTLLTDDSAGGEGSRYTNCADLIAISPPPNTENPPSGGGEPPPVGPGQIPAEGGGGGEPEGTGGTGGGEPEGTGGTGGGMPEPLGAGIGGQVATGVAVAVVTGLILARVRGGVDAPPER